jgi:hypothetical protein
MKTRRGGLEAKCPECGIWRKYREPDENHGGEPHPRRPPWEMLNNRKVCGWCAMRLRGQATWTVRFWKYDNDPLDITAGKWVTLTRDAKTGKIIK